MWAERWTCPLLLPTAPVWAVVKPARPVPEMGIRSRALLDTRIRAQWRVAVGVVSQENAEQDAAGAW